MIFHLHVRDILLVDRSVQRSGLQHGDLLKELPVTIKNSRLMNALLCELDTRDTQPKKMNLLGLSSRFVH